MKNAGCILIGLGIFLSIIAIFKATSAIMYDSVLIAGALFGWGGFCVLVGSVFLGCGAIVEELKKLNKPSAITEIKKEIHRENIEITSESDYIPTEPSGDFTFSGWVASNFIDRSGNGLSLNKDAVTQFVYEMKLSRPDENIDDLVIFYRDGIEAIKRGLPENIRNEFSADLQNKM